MAAYIYIPANVELPKVNPVHGFETKIKPSPSLLKNAAIENTAAENRKTLKNFLKYDSSLKNIRKNR